MSECENVHHVTEFNNTLKQLAKTFGREKAGDSEISRGLQICPHI